MRSMAGYEPLGGLEDFCGSVGHRLGGSVKRRYKPPPRPFQPSPSTLSMTERTFSILKPDATKRNLTGKINAVIEEAGLRIVGQRRTRLSRVQAEKFYEI